MDSFNAPEITQHFSAHLLVDSQCIYIEAGIIRLYVNALKWETQNYVCTYSI